MRATRFSDHTVCHRPWTCEQGRRAGLGDWTPRSTHCGMRGSGTLHTHAPTCLGVGKAEETPKTPESCTAPPPVRCLLPTGQRGTRANGRVPFPGPGQPRGLGDASLSNPLAARPSLLFGDTRERVSATHGAFRAPCCGWRAHTRTHTRTPSPETPSPSRFTSTHPTGQTKPRHL